VREGFDRGKPLLNELMPLTDAETRLFLPLSTIRSAAKP